MRTYSIRQLSPLCLGLLVPAHFMLMGISQCPDGDDADEDGWTTEDGDCDDRDATVHPGATDVCEDGIDQDCDGTDPTCSDGSTFTYVDTSSDDLSASALYDHFSGLSVAETDYILFSVTGGGSYNGEWCSERADWYVDNYLAYSTSGSYFTSGNWNRWSRSEGGDWSGADTTSYYNYFGSPCDGYAYSWCSEWGLGGRHLGTMPDGSHGAGESYASDWSYGAGWTVTITIGATRADACGF